MLKLPGIICWLASGVIFISTYLADNYSLRSYASYFPGYNNEHNTAFIPGLPGKLINISRQGSQVNTTPYFHFDSFISSVCFSVGSGSNLPTTLDSFISPVLKYRIQLSPPGKKLPSYRVDNYKRTLALIYPYHSFW
ncbi:MAG: hypothetical protein ABIW38_06760 [Ferruginibacter sp.]